MRCFDDHPMKKVSHKIEMRVRFWTLSSDAHSQVVKMRYPRDV